MPGKLHQCGYFSRVRRTVLPVSVFSISIFINAVGHIHADKSRSTAFTVTCFLATSCASAGGSYHSHPTGCRIVGLSRHSFDTRQGNDVDDTSESLYSILWGWGDVKEAVQADINAPRLHSSCSIHSIRLSRRILPALFWYLNVGIGMLLHPAVQCSVCGYCVCRQISSSSPSEPCSRLLQGGFGFRIVAGSLSVYDIPFPAEFQQTYSLSDTFFDFLLLLVRISFFLQPPFLRYTIILSISLYLGVSSRNTGKCSYPLYILVVTGA